MTSDVGSGHSSVPITKNLVSEAYRTASCLCLNDFRLVACGGVKYEDTGLAEHTTRSFVVDID